MITENLTGFDERTWDINDHTCVPACAGFYITTDISRRKMFMLKMMYKLSLDAENVNMYRPERVLRTAPKVKMKIEFTDKERVRRSPYHICNQLWDKLDSEIQSSINIVVFANRVRTQYTEL